MMYKCVAASLAFAAACLAADTTPVVIDQIIARVNGDIISTDEVQRLSRQLADELRQQGAAGPQLQQEFQGRQKDLLRDRIDELLLIQKAKELNINVDSDLSKYLATLQRQSGLTDPDKFHEWVHQQSGRTFEDFLSETKDQMMTSRVII